MNVNDEMIHSGLPKQMLTTGLPPTQELLTVAALS